MAALHDSVEGCRLQGTVTTAPAADHQGYLELRGTRGKLYVVVASDKVFLYKTQEVTAPQPAASEPSVSCLPLKVLWLRWHTF